MLLLLQLAPFGTRLAEPPQCDEKRLRSEGLAGGAVAAEVAAAFMCIVLPMVGVGRLLIVNVVNIETVPARIAAAAAGLMSGVRPGFSSSTD